MKQLVFLALLVSGMISFAAPPPPPVQGNPYSTNIQGQTVLTISPLIQSNAPITVLSSVPVTNEWGGPTTAQRISGPILATNLINGAVTVTSFGVVGDGTFEDYRRWTNAINIVSGGRGGTLILPPGSYTVWAPGLIFSRTNDFTMVGFSSVNSRGEVDNTATLITLADGANCDVITKRLGARVNLLNLAIDGNKSGQTVSGLRGVYLESNSSQIDRCTLQDILVRNVKGRGIHNDARETRFERVKCEFNDGDGIYSSASSDVFLDQILSGFNQGAGVVLNGAGFHRVRGFDLYRNLLQGLLLTNANNNTFSSGNSDANCADGILITATPGSFAYNNTFVQATIPKNNFFLAPDNTATPFASGTYSNVKLVGDLTVDNTFIACRFWTATDPSEFSHKVKYMFEDARQYYLTNDFIGNRTYLLACNFITDTNYFELGPFQANLVQYAYLDSYLDGSRLLTDNINLRDITGIDIRATDELESSLGLEGNVYFDPSITNFVFRQEGSGWNIRQRYDNPIWGLQYAGKGTQGVLAPLVTGLNLNGTNGNVGIGLGDTPAVEQLEVANNIKAGLIETQDGALFNAYYDGSNFRRRLGTPNGYAFKIQAQASYSNIVISVTGQGAADSVIAWTDSITVNQDGTIGLRSAPPAAASSPGNTGAFTYDSGFLYINVGPGDWRRVAVSTF